MEEWKENSGMIFAILQKMTIYAKLQKKKKTTPRKESSFIILVQ